MQQNLNLTITQVLSPRMLQMLKTLNLSYTDLLDKIKTESENNPLLEVTRNDELVAFAKELHHSRTQVAGLADYDPDAPAQDFKGQTASLTEHLLGQLKLENLSKADFEMATLLVEDLDARGYFTDYAAIKAKIMEKFNVARTHVDSLLRVIQTLEPDGVGARSLKECLILQVEQMNFESEKLRDALIAVIEDHLPLLAKKKFEEIAEALEITPEGVQHLAQFIESNLNPNPASGFKDNAPAQIVIPSFLIEPDEKLGFRGINLEEDKGPRLQINQQYLKALEDPRTDEATKNYIKEKLTAAQDMIFNYKARQENIKKLLDIIVEKQKEFFEKGSFWLKPLQQNQLAQIVGMHPSTVSRTVATKFAQTPQGFFPLKYMCPREFKGFSPYQIRARLRDIRMSNPKLSDSKITKKLQEDGLDIKRRTVAKYRSDMEKSGLLPVYGEDS